MNLENILFGSHIVMALFTIIVTACAILMPFFVLGIYRTLRRMERLMQEQRSVLAAQSRPAARPTRPVI